MTISLLKWGKTSLDYPYVITKGTCEAGFHLNIECIVYFSKVVFSSFSISSIWSWVNISSMADISYRKLHFLLCVCSHFDVNFANTGVLDTNTFTAVVGHKCDPLSCLIKDYHTQVWNSTAWASFPIEDTHRGKKHIRVTDIVLTSIWL